MKSFVVFMALCVVTLNAAVQTKGTAQNVALPVSETRWLKLTEAQRINDALWSRREYASLKPEIRGTTRETTVMTVKKTFGNSLVPKAMTQADLHCYRIVWGPAAPWHKRGQAVKFDLKYCVNGQLRQDITNGRTPAPLPTPKAGTTLQTQSGAKSAALAPVDYPPGAVVVRMYFTNYMGATKAYVYADHSSGEFWSMSTATGFYGDKLDWFTPPGFEDTGTQVRVMVPIHSKGMFFRAVRRR